MHIKTMIQNTDMPSITDALIFFGQKIIETGRDDFHIEILSRLRSPIDAEHSNIADFLQGLTVEQRFEIFSLQNKIADQLFTETGIKSAINLDNEVLESEVLRLKVLEVIQSTSAPTTYEFTETFPMPPPELMNPIFEVIRNQGKRSALDDFGTGFNGMSLFVDYDFDVIKIDRSLIHDIDSRPTKQRVLKLIIQMIETLGKSHIVEGVETESQKEILHECGFHTLQGYLLHKPEPIDNFFEIYNNKLDTNV